MTAIQIAPAMQSRCMATCFDIFGQLWSLNMYSCSHIDMYDSGVSDHKSATGGPWQIFTTALKFYGMIHRLEDS